MISIALQKKLRFVAAVAWLGTVALAATDIDWTAFSGQLWPALIAFATVALLTLVPYGLYLPIVPGLRAGPAFQVVFLTVLVSIPVILFSYWRLMGIPTNGWDFFIVPFLQLGSLALIPVAMKLTSLIETVRSDPGT